MTSTIAEWDVSAILEGLLFVSERPLSIEDMVEVLYRQLGEEREAQADAAADATDAAAKLSALKSEESLSGELAAGSADEEASSDVLTAEEGAKLSSEDGAPADENANAAAADGAANLHAAESSDPLAKNSDTLAKDAASLEAAQTAAAGPDVSAEALQDEHHPLTAHAEDADLDTAGKSADASLETDAAIEAAADAEERAEISEETIRKEIASRIEAALERMISAYQDDARVVGRGFELVAIGDGYQLRTRPLAGNFIRQFLQAKPTRLSRAQLETLAIIAYRQPVTKPEIEDIRGVDCSNAVRALLERKLVRILGKKEEVGRPLLYGTSKEFLEFFRLPSLLDLPTLREFQELSDEHRKRVEEELDQEAPLGSFKELAESAPKLETDDTELLAAVDGALSSAKQTVARVAEITGLTTGEDEPLPPQNRE